MAFQITTAIEKLQSLKNDIRIIPGGTSAGKTYGITPILINQASVFENITFSIVSESMPHLKKGVIRDFKNIMQETGRWHRKHWHESDKIYTFDSGSKLEFFSADDPGKVHGPRRQVLYVNECNNLRWETVYQMMIRTENVIWLDYNPTHEFWVHTELLNAERDDIDYLTLTYKDNEALSPRIVKELERNRIKAKTSEYWDNWCKVYLDGQLGTLQENIIKDWKEIDNIPPEARLLGYGMDFGYSNDPTTLIGVYIFNGKYLFKEFVYQTGLKIKELTDLMKRLNINKNVPIYCDSADPRMRDEIKAYGYKAISVKKGRDSVKFGIELLQTITLHITKGSVNLIKEVRRYSWDKDKNGDFTGQPIKGYDHGIDAIRYFISMVIGKRNNYSAGLEYIN